MRRVSGSSVGGGAVRGCGGCAEQRTQWFRPSRTGSCRRTRRLSTEAPSDLGVLPKGLVDLAALLPSQHERADDERQAPGEHRGEDAHQMRLAPAGWPAQERIHAVKHAEHALLLVPL